MLKRIIPFLVWLLAIYSLRPLFYESYLIKSFFGLLYWVVMVGVVGIFFFIFTSIGWLLMKKPINLSEDEVSDAFQYSLYGVVLIYFIGLMAYFFLDLPFN